jgi:hypothetical protein
MPEAQATPSASAAPTAALLAAAPGAMIAREADRDSVTFAAPPSQSPAAPLTPTIAEVPAAAPVASALGVAATAAPPPAPAGLEPAAAGPPPAPPRAGPDLEDVYDHVVERLRHDLLAERERMGDPLGDLPR